MLKPRHPPSISKACIPGPIVTALSVPVDVPEPADAAPMPNIWTVQFAVICEEASPQERERDVREKESVLGARAICFGWEVERARRWVGGGRGEVGFELEAGVVKGVKVV